MNAVDKVALKINIDAENSCHCPSNCCFSISRNQINPKTEVYVDSAGIVQEFDPQKAYDRHQAVQRSLNNLEAKVRQIARDHARDEEAMVRYLLLSKLSSYKEGRITVKEINSLNTQIAQYLK